MRLKRIIYSLIVMLSCISITTNAQVAKIGETNYDTFQAAIDAVQDGETITLLGECAENVSFTQTKDVSFVLDGANKVFTGSINITARAGKDAPSTLVIKNFNCTTTKTSHDFIKSVEKNYYPNNITINVTQTTIVLSYFFLIVE